MGIAAGFSPRNNPYRTMGALAPGPPTLFNHLQHFSQRKLLTRNLYLNKGEEIPSKPARLPLIPIHAD